VIRRMSIERQCTLYGIADHLIVFYHEHTHAGRIPPGRSASYYEHVRLLSGLRQTLWRRRGKLAVACATRDTGSRES
jgi:hypothetical protein